VFGIVVLRSGEACGDLSVVADGFGLFGVLWCDCALECSWGTSLLSTVRHPRSWVRGMGSLFGARDRELVSFFHLEAIQAVSSTDDASSCPCNSWWCYAEDDGTGVSSGAFFLSLCACCVVCSISCVSVVSTLYQPVSALLI
jgi:hypothetical protein